MQNYLNNRHFAYSLIFKKLFWLSLALATVLLLIELKPNHDSWQYKDKVEHIFSFFVLNTLGLFSYQHKPQQIWIGLTAYGLLMEGLQGALTISRTASWYDWLADCVGIGISLILIASLKSAFQKSARN